ncbi:MAG: prolyl oligopeptidase family serine peptidase, partial [Planctomycetota bacterium]
GGAGPFALREVEVPGTLGPLCLERVGLPIEPRAGDPPPGEPGVLDLPVSLTGPPAVPPAAFQLKLAVRASGEARRHTFRSGIDGTLQEFTLLPPARSPSFRGQPGLVLTLHGAGVDAFGQARSYAPKPDFWILAPTNRRPFGFDWQDWGREDACEALDRALEITGVDPRRVYLTGHSMGGHGAWHLAVNDPDRFAAVAPSAGWASFDSYTGRPEGKRAGLWKRADGASLTGELLANLAWEGLPIYVLHGTADDNVPVSEARQLIAALREKKPAPHLASHFQEGAGHWWDGDASPGVDCVDWPPIFEMFRKAPIGEIPSRIEFLTMDPGIDSRHHWIGVAQPLVYGRPAHVEAEWDPGKESVAVTTWNARRIRVDAPAGELAAVRLDGSAFQGADLSRGAWFLRQDGSWRRCGAGVPAGEKTPRRSGPFKRAFAQGFLLVYGTRGNPEENRELFQRARYDAEVWSYRANGNAPLLGDAEFLEELENARLRGRNVILYGNKDTNSAWTAVFGGDCPLRAERGRIRLGEKEWQGPDLGCLFVQPRRNDPDALAAAFADSGPRGTRLGYTLAPFISGVGYPDYAVFDAGILRSGDGGVLAAGWFDVRWKP